MSRVCTYIFGTLLILSVLCLFNAIIILGVNTPAWLIAVLVSVVILFIIGLALSLAIQENQKTNSITPKYQLGQWVFVRDWAGQLRSGRIDEIQTNSVLHDKQPLITYLVSFGAYSDDEEENDYYQEHEVYEKQEEAK